MERIIRVGTRGSALALWQANWIEQLLRNAHPEAEMERIIIKTEGDRDQRSSLTQIGGQGVFTKAIEDALIAGRIDIAVHSLKDLPSQMTNGLILGAVPQRASVQDVLVTNDGRSFSELQRGARVATGSIRRRSQLLSLRPDLKTEDLRGNIDTRLRKLKDKGFDAIIMAKAAILRLGLDDVKYYTFSEEELLPAVGQGAVGVQIRENDEQVNTLVSAINNTPAMACVSAERAFLRELDSGCQFPVGALARQDGDGMLILRGFVGSEDGTELIREKSQGPTEKAAQLGTELARRFIGMGALTILKNVNDG